MLGLPFPTYLAWFVGPISTILVLAYVLTKYKQFLNEEEGKKKDK